MQVGLFYTTAKNKSINRPILKVPIYGFIFITPYNLPHLLHLHHPSSTLTLTPLYHDSKAGLVLVGVLFYPFGKF